MQHTREVLFEEGLARGIYIAPTLDIGSLMEEKHFASRNYWHRQQLDGKPFVFLVRSQRCRRHRSL